MIQDPLDKISQGFNELVNIVSNMSHTIDGSNQIVLSGGDGSAPKLLFNETIIPNIGETRTRTWLEFQPLEKNMGSAPFTFTQAVTKYGAWQGDEVFMMGWNLSPGGGLRIQGEPAVGISMEQHYKPTHGGLGLTEFHDFWIKPNGEQVRLKSYTMFNETGQVDFYHSVAPFYLRSPQNPGNVYFRVSSDPAGSATEMRLNGYSPVIIIGKTVLQSVEWSTGQALKIGNAGLILSAMKAPAGTKKPLVIDDEGNVTLGD